MPTDLRTRYLANPALCRCGHPDYYHRDTYHGDPCDHWLCDCGSYDPEDDMLDNDDTLATGIAVIVALAVWVAALIVGVWWWTR